MKKNIDKNTVLFLDRDGVINRRIPGDYIKHWDEFEFLPGAKQAIAYFSKIFSKIFVVTNQQGIGKGIMTAESLQVIHNKMVSELESYGGKIDKVYYCPKLKTENPSCRKPRTGMAQKAQKDFPLIRFNNAVMIGDSLSDIGFGSRLNMHTVLLTTNEEALAELKEKGLPDKSWYINDKARSLFAYAQTLGMRKLVPPKEKLANRFGYSRCVRVDNIVEVAALSAYNFITPQIYEDAYAQSKIIFQKIKQALEDVDAKMSDVIRTRIYTTDLKYVEDIGRAHGEFFEDINPVSTIIEVNGLVSPHIIVTIEACAVVQ